METKALFFKEIGLHNSQSIKDAKKIKDADKKRYFY